MVDKLDKKVSLLEENIKTKGENAYYYAHKRIVDERNKTDKEEGITLTGPGIITGGDPVLLGTSNKPTEVIKENKKFTKYLFIDDDGFATIKIDLPEEIKDKLTSDDIKCSFTEKTLDLIASANGCDPYYLVVKKLFKKIVAEESKFKLNKGKIIINLKKKDADDEWDKLNA